LKFIISSSVISASSSIHIESIHQLYDYIVYTLIIVFYIMLLNLQILQMLDFCILLLEHKFTKFNKLSALFYYI